MAKHRSFLRLMMGRWGVWATFLTFFSGVFWAFAFASVNPEEIRVTRTIATGAGSVALFLWFLSVSRAHRLRNLRRVGKPTSATVIAHRKRGNKSGGAPIYRAEWRTDHGLEGNTPPLRSERLPPVGSTITVLVAPNMRSGVWAAEV